MNLAAESHVDRSIDAQAISSRPTLSAPSRCCRKPYATVRPCAEKRARSAFCMFRTDEVFGSLGEKGLFTETAAYAPTRPTRRARPPPIISCGPGTRHMGCRRWSPTAPTIRPLSFPGEADPAHDHQGLASEPLPVYATAKTSRLALRRDHARALTSVLEHGQIGRDL